MKFSRPVTLLALNLVVALSLLSTSFTAHALPAYPESKSSSSSSTAASLPPRSLSKQTRSKSTSSFNSQAHSKTKTKKLNHPKSQKDTLLQARAQTQVQAQAQEQTPLSPSTKQLQSSISKSDHPLLLLPSSKSVWHAGSTQTVKWSKKYAKRLPKDTTVDIVLVDSKTNKTIRSLKRFIPYRKGSAKVWVPFKLPQDASYVLVLELFHGRSQRPATVETKASLPSVPLSSSTTRTTPTTTSTTTTTTTTTATSSASDTKHDKNIPSILRRSDINIAHRERTSSLATTTTTTTTVHHDVNDEDYYKGHDGAKSFEFAPDEVRQEFPNVIQPIELQHTFGLHQKVYTMAPYTLEWKIPARVTELLEYTKTRLRLMTDKTIDLSRHHLLRDNSEIFMAKILVELVRDQTMEPVSVLARNVPAEAKFQYLQIHKRVPPAFYRLKIQMVVVSVQSGHESDVVNHFDVSEPRIRSAHGDYIEGWDFPNGGRVIDRYESITRRFWVTGGAL
ncbi:hypothetical protein BGX21_000773 [Mortierella sp. AD011]|nr:hypothetical protein BGX20_000538 [Mortierella sp. AD010]KAF9386546.1 hypothetical protein BGX21_000773 [Mortierella sp. AD011]